MLSNQFLTSYIKNRRRRFNPNALLQGRVTGPPHRDARFAARKGRFAAPEDRIETAEGAQHTGTTVGIVALGRVSLWMI